MLGLSPLLSNKRDTECDLLADNLRAEWSDGSYREAVEFNKVLSVITHHGYI